MKKLFFLSFFSLFILSVSAQSYEDLVLSSADYVEKKDYKTAEALLLEAFEKDPENKGNTLLFTNLGTIQRHLGETDKALTSYSAALELSPKANFVLHNRAALYCELNDFDNALKDYSSIILFDNTDVDAYYRRGLIYVSKNNMPAAQADFYKIKELDPENIRSDLGLANIYKSRNEWDKAEEVYSDLIFKYKKLPLLYYNRADCYINLKQNGRAMIDLNKAIDLGFKDASVYVMRGQIKLKQYDKLGAKLDFKKAKELGADAEFIDKLIKNI